MNFLHTFYPSLLKLPGFLVEFITPIIKARAVGTWAPGGGWALGPRPRESPPRRGVDALRRAASGVRDGAGCRNLAPLTQTHTHTHTTSPPPPQAKKDSRVLSFYTIPEYEAWREGLASTAGWDIKYYKVGPQKMTPAAQRITCDQGPKQ